MVKTAPNSRKTITFQEAHWSAWPTTRVLAAHLQGQVYSQTFLELCVQ